MDELTIRQLVNRIKLEEQELLHDKEESKLDVKLGIDYNSGVTLLAQRLIDDLRLEL